MRGTDDEGAGRAVPELEGLYADRPLPPELEERVVGGLVDEGLIASPSRGRRPPRWWRTAILQTAAALVLFAGGVWAGGVWAGAAGTAEPPPEGGLAEPGPAFMLLLWEGEGWNPPDDPEAVAAAYASWAGSLARAGVPISGDELGLERTVIGAAAARASEGAMIGGYFIVGAESAEQARALVEGHPHLANGGAIEIAPIVER